MQEALHKPTRWSAGAIVCLPLACPAAVETAEATGVGGSPAVEHVYVSPSGERVVAIATSGAKRAAAVIELAGGQPKIVLQQTDAERQFLDACGWVSDHRIVCSVFLFRPGNPFSRAVKFKVRLVAVDLDGGNQQTLLDRAPPRAPRFFGGPRPPVRRRGEDSEHAIVHDLPSEPDHVLIRAARDAEPYTSVYRLNVEDGSVERVLEYQQGIIFWHADASGRLRLGTGWYEVGPWRGSQKEQWVGPTAVAVAADDTIRRIDVSRIAMRIGERDLAGPYILGFSPDGSRVYYEAAVDGAQRAAVWEADAATLLPQRQLVADPLRDVRATAVAGTACGVVGFMHTLPDRPFTWLDRDFGADVGAAARQLVEAVVAAPSMSADCRRVVLATDVLAGRRYYLLDREDGSLRRLGEQHPGVAAAGIDRRRVTYSTRDGRQLPMTLTLPAGTGPLPPPVVVVFKAEAPASSVEARDAWPHYFASRGYAVAQPVVRGQRGYGWQDHLAGRRQDGLKLQEDAQDALAWLDAQDLADARRACFAGRAAGGHLALAAASVGKPPDSDEHGARCVAAYAPRDLRRARRNQLGPFGGCLSYPCDDWMCWAASRTVSSKRCVPRAGPVAFPPIEPARSPIVDARYPGFPVLIWEAEGVLHEQESPRYRKDVGKLGYFERLAPIGSANEAAFLKAAEALFARELVPDAGVEKSKPKRG